jgi:hypothetical protein
MAQDSAPWAPGDPRDRSIFGFRARHGSRRGPMSMATYCRLRVAGRAPREIVLTPGTIIITVADEAAWDAARSNPVGAEAQLVARMRAARVERAQKAGQAAAMSPRHVSKQRKRRQR